MGLFDMFKRKDEVIKRDRLVIEDDEVAGDEVAEERAASPDSAEAPSATADEDDEPEEFAKEAPLDREERGPFDAEEHSGEGAFIDLGALRIPAQKGLALRLEFEDKTKRVIAVGLDKDKSTLQVQAFAAPRSTGLWADVRRQLVAQVAKQGGKSNEVETELGTALRAAIPVVQGTDKARIVQFFGVDGPRWFLRGVVTGPATANDEKLTDLLSLFRAIVVDRGPKPIPPRDLLPLTVPKAMAEQMAAAAAKQREQRAARPTEV